MDDARDDLEPTPPGAGAPPEVTASDEREVGDASPEDAVACDEPIEPDEPAEPEEPSSSEDDEVAPDKAAASDEAAAPQEAAEAPPAPEGMDLDEGDLSLVVEALLFATTSPLSINRIVGILDNRHDAGAVRRAIDDLKDRYNREGHAFAIEEIAGGCQIFTRPDYYPWVRRMLRSKKEIKLSRAALETLAIVAYKQPIIRSEIDDIRGVNVGPMLRNLMDMNLVKVVGRSEQLGRPMQYGTTQFFLEHFGLKNIKDLPDVRELERPE